MARDTLTGSRIRERRVMIGMRQVDLARQAGISASYLNLIEHNRRRIGGKLLLQLAQMLGVEPSMLTEGAEAALIAALREAAADTGTNAAEIDRADEFAGRFPGWAEVLATAHRRIASLERTVETLSDRLTHDPHLAASLHELLSTAAAIRSTASILAETGELEAEWRDRFHANLNEDSLRLADSSKALVRYLDESGEAEDRPGIPQEEVEAFLTRHDYHFPTLEKTGGDIDVLIRAAPELTSAPSRQLARGALIRYREDARAMPLPRMRASLGTGAPDPAELAVQFDVRVASVLRRLAALPPGELAVEPGIVICDAAGSIIHRKPAPGFALPRFGACCPLWPLFSALSRPHLPIRRRVAQQGRGATRFDCLAVAEPAGVTGFDDDPQYLSTMLILPVPGADTEHAPDLPVHPVGSSCRVCSRSDCPARREPSILSEGF